MKFTDFTKKFSGKFDDIKYASINSLIYHNYYHKEIDENLVYVESRNGRDLTGNVFRIVEELSTGKYGDLKIVVYAKEEVHQKIKGLERNYSLKIDQIVSGRTKGTMIMEKAKYIITDSTLFHKFVKRPGQIVLNTWHGTPLMSLGISSSTSAYKVANIQQVLFASDYLLYPNEYCRDKIMTDYMMEKVYPGKILIGGYPRNSAFFKSNNIKEELDLSDKEIFAYMPSFKGVKSFLNKKDRKDTIENYLKEIDERLSDNQILFVNFHYSNANEFDLNKYKHIRAFPQGYEIYDVLSIADKLVSDYAEVIFDFINTKRKIILFAYDELKLLKNRQTYVPLSGLPFPKVDNVDDLISELNSPKGYDDAELSDAYCRYDDADAAENLCRHIFNHETILKEEKVNNPNRNTLIFTGTISKNGITSSLINLLSEVDPDEHNYFISYRTWSKYMQRNFSEISSLIPKGIECAPLRTPINPTLKERFHLTRFIKSKNKNMELPDCLKELFRRELKRSYGEFEFDNVIQFKGYGENEILMFSQSDSNKIIWAHGNMIKEIEAGKNNYVVLRQAYNAYDKVVVVSDETVDNTYRISGRKDNIRVIHNINNYKQIIENSKKDIEFDDNTIMMCSNPEGINGVLKSPGKKFITIGRFAEEKNHKVLIDAFNEFSYKYPDTQLIIIGGYGPEYFRTRRYAEKKEFRHNITIIRAMFNPMPILAKCDLFILPSKHEGWPMTIMEANTLGIPIIASDINATQWLKDYDVYLFKNNVNGIRKAMDDFMLGKVKNNLDIDYEEYNRNVLDEFIELIN